MLRKFKKPRKFDRNLIVLGAGSAGLVTAYIAATTKAKVTLIEQDKMGGDCLNTGCIPSKALLRSAKFIAHTRRASEFGVKSAKIEFDFADIMQRVRRIIATVAPHDSIERYQKMGVECLTGKAIITSPWTIEVNSRAITTRNIIIATGAQPLVPPISGIENIDYYTSDTIWNMKQLPKRFVIIGGGPIGSELAQCFTRFGSQVTQIELSPRLLPREDPEVSELIKQRFENDGISVLTHHKAKQFLRENNEKTLICEHQNQKVRIPFDSVLIASGRHANITGYGLEEMGISISDNKLETNRFLQTSCPNIFACGDVTGHYQFTHTAAHQAWYATVNALFGTFKKFTVDYSVIPWATFTDPEVARVGINETEANNQHIPYEVTTYEMKELDRAIADEETHGLVKVITVPGKDKILGATIVGDHAGELISEYITAMCNKTGLNKILSTIHIYPTLMEANKYAAGQWKRARISPYLLNWVEKYHHWRRN